MSTSKSTYERPTKTEVMMVCSLVVLVGVIFFYLFSLIRSESIYHSGAAQMSQQIEVQLFPSQSLIFKAIDRNITSNACVRHPDKEHHAQYRRQSRQFIPSKEKLLHLGAQAWVKCFNEQLSLISPANADDFQALVDIGQGAEQLLDHQ